ncbi:MAG: hypothetical protein GY861_21060 [bacterium]|nr:hypothetical protein [bacterium]
MKNEKLSAKFWVKRVLRLVNEESVIEVDPDCDTDYLGNLFINVRISSENLQRPVDWAIGLWFDMKNENGRWLPNFTVEELIEKIAVNNIHCNDYYSYLEESGLPVDDPEFELYMDQDCRLAEVDIDEEIKQRVVGIVARKMRAVFKPMLEEFLAGVKEYERMVEEHPEDFYPTEKEMGIYRDDDGERYTMINGRRSYSV